MTREVNDFLKFLQDKGVAGLAIGFVIGGGVVKVVTSLINNIINPLLSLLLGFTGRVSEQFVMVGSAKVSWGEFVVTLIDFIVLAFVVYYGVKLLGLDQKKPATVENKRENKKKE